MASTGSGTEGGRSSSSNVKNVFDDGCWTGVPMVNDDIALLHSVAIQPSREVDENGPSRVAVELGHP
jgi:hypothetical protein